MGRLHPSHEHDFGSTANRLVEAAHVAALEAIAKAMARDEAPARDAPQGVAWFAAAIVAASGAAAVAVLLR